MSARSSSVQQHYNVNKPFITPIVSNCCYLLLVSPAGNHTAGPCGSRDGSIGFRHICCAGKTCLFLGGGIKIFRNRLETDHRHIVENTPTRNPYSCVVSLHMQHKTTDRHGLCQHTAINTGLLEMFVGVLTTCHTKYT